MVRLIDAAGVYPKVLQAITLSLLGAKGKLVVAILAMTGAISQILEGYLLAILPGVREYCIGRDRVVSNKVSQAEHARVVAV